MTQMLHWTSSHLTRRRFVKRVAATTFGLFAGLAAGIPEIAYAGACGGMACAGCNCSGFDCVACGSTACQNRAPGACTENQRCWQSSGHYCCDCVCRSGSFGFNCTCHVVP